MADVIDKAIQLFEEGFLPSAARVLARERVRAANAEEADRLNEIDDVVKQMRSQLDERKRDEFDQNLIETGGGAALGESGHDFSGLPAVSARSTPAVDISPVGAGLALAGALAMVIGVFLPRVETSAFAFVKDNTLIQSGDGWIFLGLVLGNVGSVYRAYKRRRRTWAPLVLGVVAIVVAIYDGTGGRLKLCSLTITTACQQASPGIGIYVVGVGGLLVAAGGWQLLTARRSAPAIARPEAGSKICPECAETVKDAARVCKHCGYRFAPAVATDPNEN